VKSEAKTVEEYINNLPGDRAAQIAEVRKTILENLPIEKLASVWMWGSPVCGFAN